HLAGDRVRLDVLGAVHLGGADLVTGQAREDEDLLGGHALDVRDGTVGGRGGQRDPLSAAVELAVPGQLARTVDLEGGRVPGQPGDVQGALVEQRAVVLAGPAA